MDVSVVESSEPCFVIKSLVNEPLDLLVQRNQDRLHNLCD